MELPYRTLQPGSWTPAPDPAVIVQGGEAMAALQDAMEQLPPRQQQAFAMRCLEGMDVATTARVMGCSAGSVKTHYHRAQQALRERLKDVIE